MSLSSRVAGPSAGALLTTALLLLSGPPAAAQVDELPGPRAEDRAVLFGPHAGLRPELLRPLPVTLGVQDDFDALRYDLSVFLDVDEARVEGSCLVTFTPIADPLPAIALDLRSATMIVSAVSLESAHGAAVDHAHADHLLTINFDPPLTGVRDPVVVRVEWAGAPRQLSFGTLRFDTHGDPEVPLIYSLAEPYLARDWWPSKDRPDDKADVRLSVDAPEELVVVSNGLQVERVASPGAPDRAVTTWESRYPISTYLVSIAATNYETWTDVYQTLSPLDGAPADVPVTYWAWPEKADEAREDWSVTVPMMDFFGDAYGEYPFWEEKYGHAMIRMSGAMEHQTATSYGAALVRGDHRYDFVVAHELAHQWWGDLVGPTSFDSIWLNEGFASWAEAL